MTLTVAVLVAGLACLLLKLIGYLLPERWLAAPRAMHTADLLTVALLAALLVVQTLGDGRDIVVDARLPAVAVAALLLWRRAPFLVVVIAAAVVAAGLRAVGWAA